MRRYQFLYQHAIRSAASSPHASPHESPDPFGNIVKWLAGMGSGSELAVNLAQALAIARTYMLTLYSILKSQ